MPRQPRLEAPGLMYHVIARGVERKDIFRQAKDYEAFLHRLGDILAQTKVECRAFCLMPNHFHLLLKQTDTPLSSAMRRLLTGYALYFNRARKRSGHLFQNRYKSIICQEDRYLLELIRYIHLNPVRARLTKTFEALTGYPYSGHACLTGKHAYDWYPPERVLELFGRTKARATNAYRQFMLEGLSLGKNPVYSGGGLKRSLGYPKQYPAEPQAYDERILGESDFVLALKTTEENTRRNAKESLDPERLLEDAANAFGLTADAVRGTAKTPAACDARALTAHLAVAHLGLSFAGAASLLNVHRSTIPRVLERGEHLSKTIRLGIWSSS